MIHSKWSNYLHIYQACIYRWFQSASPPEEGRVAASFYVPEYYKHISRKRMEDFTSVFRAELAAILLALFWSDQLPSLYTGVVIFSNSLSGLQSIKSQKEENLINTMYKFTFQGNFCKPWVDTRTLWYYRQWNCRQSSKACFADTRLRHWKQTLKKWI